MTEKLSAWTAVLSSIITVGLTVYNATLNTKIEQAKVDLTRVQTEINQKYAELEVRKERTTRYEFVNKLLPDVLKKDRSQGTLTTNLISLALTEDEARKLFDGFQISQDINVQEVGKIGQESLNKQITQQRDRLSLALAHESREFEALIAEDYQTALMEFVATDNVYPTFHQAYEISRLLRQNLDAMSDSGKKKKYSGEL